MIHFVLCVVLNYSFKSVLWLEEVKWLKLGLLKGYYQLLLQTQKIPSDLMIRLQAPSTKLHHFAQTIQIICELYQAWESEIIRCSTYLHFNKNTTFSPFFSKSKLTHGFFLFPGLVRNGICSTSKRHPRARTWKSPKGHCARRPTKFRTPIIEKSPRLVNLPWLHKWSRVRYWRIWPFENESTTLRTFQQETKKKEKAATYFLLIKICLRQKT